MAKFHRYSLCFITLHCIIGLLCIQAIAATSTTPEVSTEVPSATEGITDVTNTTGSEDGGKSIFMESSTGETSSIVYSIESTAATTETWETTDEVNAATGDTASEFSDNTTVDVGMTVETASDASASPTEAQTSKATTVNSPSSVTNSATKATSTVATTKPTKHIKARLHIKMKLTLKRKWSDELTDKTSKVYKDLSEKVLSATIDIMEASGETVEEMGIVEFRRISIVAKRSLSYGVGRSSAEEVVAEINTTVQTTKSNVMLMSSVSDVIDSGNSSAAADLGVSSVESTVEERLEMDEDVKDESVDVAVFADTGEEEEVNEGENKEETKQATTEKAETTPKVTPLSGGAIAAIVLSSVAALLIFGAVLYRRHVESRESADIAFDALQ